MKSLVKTIRNIFQDAVIRIPYFLSALKPTTTIAILQDTDEYANTFINQISQITQIINTAEGVLASQCKLYFEKQQSRKTIIVQFQSLQSARSFYQKYSKNYDKSLFQNSQIIQQSTDNKRVAKKYLIYFCKDITANGVNMQQVLYSIGKISVQNPESAQMRSIIKQVAKLVVVEGIRGEQQLLNSKSSVLTASSTCLLDFMNPKFLSSEATYYRWRVYSYLQGDGDKNYRTQPFQMTTGGPLYHPPDQYSDKYSYRILHHSQRQYVTKLLQSLTPRKYHIEQSMSFCITNVSSAVQICSIIALCIVEKCDIVNSDQQNAKNNRNLNIKHIISLFYLISDIIFNSPNTIYRDIFTVILPSIMDRLPKISELTSKLSDIIQNWNKKFMFEDEFLRGLTLLIKGELPSMKANGMQQMTRSQHECYKNLLKIQTPDQIEQMCWKYGLAFSSQKIAECLRNLAAVLSMDPKQSVNQMEPECGEYDGQPLNEKDIIKIKTKSCKIVSCQDLPVRYLLQKERGSKSISLQKD